MLPKVASATVPSTGTDQRGLAAVSASNRTRAAADKFYYQGSSLFYYLVHTIDYIWANRASSQVTSKFHLE